AAPAFAANPFMDVPMNHWAYDAVSQLAARGIVTGYPDGAFKGEWKATRYEMASIVARALAYVDMNKASREDLELLKRLVVEFKDELDALGVKVEDLDGRVSTLEKDIGGWRFWGELRFDAKWGDNDGVDKDSAYGLTGDTDFNLNRYRIYMQKKVDDKLTFTARIGKSGDSDMKWDRYYVTIKMPWDSTARIGKWNFDWEGEDGFYNDNDAWFTDQTPVGFYWSKPFSTGQFDAFVTHADDTKEYYYDGTGEGFLSKKPKLSDESYFYGMRLKFAFNEQFGMGLVGLIKDYDETWLTDAGTSDWAVYWAQAYVNFTPNIQLRGRYMMQDFDKAVEVASGALTDDPSALHGVLEISQEALGFTSLWIEYADIEEGFRIDTDDPYANYGATVLGTAINEDTEVFFVRADQTWNEKWGTFQRYVDVNRDLNQPDVTNWTFGVNYWYTPNIKFELVYDDLDYDGDRADDNMIRLRTHVWF
ncbi:MAG: S-layer domain-containing protein, partial [Synergistales bacterium 54_9]